MPKKGKSAQSDSINISFARQNPDNERKDHRLHAEILRVHAIEKQKASMRAWRLSQQQLCQFFTNYQLFPQDYLSIDMLLDSAKLKLIKSQGKIYFGQVDRRQRHGWGIQIEKSGQVYEGEFQGNEKKGKGIEVYSNANLYIGEYLNNKKHGSGVFYWFNLASKHPKQQPTIEYYQGQWWGGLPDGQGTHTKANGDLYLGSFKNGLKHGQGEENYSNGDHYRGQFVNGLPQGYGEYHWSDSSSYRGDFKQGLRSGYGVWKASKNRLQFYQGQYCSDKKSGYGVYTWDNGWTYRGNFQNDYRSGYGQLYNSQNELQYEGQWELGQQVDRQHAKFQLYAEQNPQRKQSIYNEFSSSNLRSTQLSNRRSAKANQFDYAKNISDRYQSVQNPKHSYNRQELCEFATLSYFGQQNLCKRPETQQRRRGSFQSKSIRIRQGQVGTKITRPLAPGPTAIVQRNKSCRRF